MVSDQSIDFDREPASQPAGREGRIARSWRLTRAAWRVVRSDRALLTLAVFSGVFGVASIVATFALGGLLGDGRFSEGRFLLAALILAYPLMFISVFINTAIAAAAGASLEGRRLSLGQALGVPMRRIGQVALWALIAAGVGVLIEQLAARLPFFGSIAMRLVGVAWSLASLFAIPILALEGCSAPQALRRSAHVVKERWGEGISGNVIISAWTVLVVVPVALVLGLALAASNAVAVRDAVILVGALSIVAIFAIAAVVRQTFAVALYRYAASGTVQGPFEQRDLQAPFHAKRGRSSSTRS